jgi:hypothetical protein
MILKLAMPQALRDDSSLTSEIKADFANASGANPEAVFSANPPIFIEC